MKMNERVKKIWTEALDSGEYKQGKNRLRRDDEFCCLGVLCDLHAKETGGKWESNGLWSFYMDESNCLPIGVQGWAGLDRGTGAIVKVDKDSNCLSYLNDTGKTFSCISQLIKDQL